jgi:hypothetical protein
MSYMAMRKFHEFLFIDFENILKVVLISQSLGGLWRSLPLRPLRL